MDYSQHAAHPSGRFAFAQRSPRFAGSRTAVVLTTPTYSYLPLVPTRWLTLQNMVQGGGFEPPKLARQIYSLIPLATREPLRLFFTCLTRKMILE